MRRLKLITILFFAGTSLTAQNNFTQEAVNDLIHPVGISIDTLQRSVVVELTAFQKKELLGIDEREQKLTEQYKLAMEQLQQIRLKSLTWIADSKGIKIEDIKDISRENDSIIFKLKTE